MFLDFVGLDFRQGIVQVVCFCFSVFGILGGKEVGGDCMVWDWIIGSFVYLRVWYQGWNNLKVKFRWSVYKWFFYVVWFFNSFALVRIFTWWFRFLDVSILVNKIEILFFFMMLFWKLRRVIFVIFYWLMDLKVCLNLSVCVRVNWVNLFFCRCFEEFVVRF